MSFVKTNCNIQDYCCFKPLVVHTALVHHWLWRVWLEWLEARIWAIWRNLEEGYSLAGLDPWTQTRFVTHKDTGLQSTNLNRMTYFLAKKGEGLIWGNIRTGLIIKFWWFYSIMLKVLWGFQTMSCGYRHALYHVRTYGFYRYIWHNFEDNGMVL